ncbi:porin [Halomonas sp. 18H]|uniref:porin n=1 Tax=Halomonas almeriensis TaxID=308163 RepID=UPI00222FDB57|nr:MULTISPECIES: porin [Halomonas]MCW4149493.1 porin [Halomonas sp. 18H]MDN3553561.1 porin [Halomonas almeriensis]
MKKTLLATAIAGAMVASGAQAATVYNQDGTKLDIYGNIQIAVYSIKGGNGEYDTQLTDNGTTFGFAAEHVIYDGLTGYMKLELDDIKADEMKTDIDNDDSGDQAYVGLKGNFGDVKLGSYDTLMDDWIQDPVTNNEGFDVSDSNQYTDSAQETDQLTYVSPSFNGLEMAIGTQFKGDAEAENVANENNASIFGGAKYTAGNFSVAAVYDNLDNYEVKGAGFAADQEWGDRYGITGQYTMDSLRVALKLERFDSAIDDVDSTNYYGLGARYGYGQGDVYAAYQYIDVGGLDFTDTADNALTSGDFPNEDDNESYNEIIVGANYSISDSMYTWAEAAFRDQENDAGDGVGVGVTYMF